VNFKKLLEHLNHQESKSMLAIRNGIGVRTNFWDDFLLLLNDSESISELFGVPIEKVSTWKSKIHNALKEVKKHDTNIVAKEKGKLLKTGLPEENK
jgi:Trm5-related predicted tRNA methylase